jgi:hypothetical protein
MICFAGVKMVLPFMSSFYSYIYHLPPHTETIPQGQEEEIYEVINSTKMRIAGFAQQFSF